MPIKNGNAVLALASDFVDDWEHQGLVPVSFNGKISYGIIQRAATDQRVL
jgi:hypothetical protein